MLIFKGLPHPTKDAKEYKEEKTNKETIGIHGHAFYRYSIPFSDLTEKRLLEILSEKDTFKDWSGEKKCMGFHPDYAITCMSNNKTNLYLICFGCGEIKVYRDDKEWYFDIGKEALQKLKIIFDK